MKPFNHMLVAIDTRLDAHPIVDEAARIAKLNGATLKLVDVVPDFPWIARLMLKEHANLHQMLGREIQDKLDTLASSIRDEGVGVETKVLWGKTSVEVIREVLRGRHDVVLAVAKGKNSRQKGFFGTTARRLLRECPCAVWLVADADTPDYNHVMACIDTSTDHELDAELNTKVYELASMVSRQHEARSSIVQAWRMDGEELLKGRIPIDDFTGMLDQRREYVERLFNEFLQPDGRQISDDDVHLLKGDPADVIPSFASENSVDLIVMGTVARSGLSGLIIGNTAERILNEIKCSVLAVKPDSFASPITESEYIDFARETSHAH